jgi:predicted Zn-dependent protease
MKQGFTMEVVPSVVDPVRQALRDRGVEGAASEYKLLRAEKPDGYDFAEPELNRLGYELLRAGKATEAVAIFRWNAEAYPRSANAQDSLADGCRAAGDRACADAAARMILELLKTDTTLPPEFKRSLEQNARKQLEESAKN